MAKQLVLLLGALAAHGQTLEFLEDFSFAGDRAKALEELVPGTDAYYYYHCLLLQHESKLEAVPPLVERWERELGRTQMLEQILNRQALLSYERDPKTSLAELKRLLGVTFDHQPSLPGATTSHPTALDQGLISWQHLRAKYLTEGPSLNAFKPEAMEWLLAEPLSPEQRKLALDQLPLPDVENLVTAVVADFKTQRVLNFGASAIHAKLTLAQLDACAAQLPALRELESFIQARLRQLRPPAYLDDVTPPAENGPYLATLHGYVTTLPGSFNSLKANVLYHLLFFRRAQGDYDAALFTEYLKLPREASYMEPTYLQRAGRDRFQLSRGLPPQTGLPAVSNDESLVRDFLRHFLQDAADYKLYLSYLRESWLKQVFVETKLLAGKGNLADWAELSGDPAFIQELRDRIDLEFAPTNKTRFTTDEAVRLELDVKNVKSLLVKIYEVNTVNFYRDQGREVGLDLDLDGMVPNHERRVTYSEPPLQRVRRGFDFPELAKRGVYVVEFIGGGRSSRALVKKGALRAVHLPTVAGQAFRVLDESGQEVPDASLWLDGRSYSPQKDGSILIPYTTSAGPKVGVLEQNGFADMIRFQHLDEVYALEGGIFVNQEALKAGETANLLVRAELWLHGWRIPGSLLKDVSLSVETLNGEGTAATIKAPDFQLVDDAETAFSFRVPDDVRQLTFTVSAKVANRSQGQDDSLQLQETMLANGHYDSAASADFHLSRSREGYGLYLVGRSGEPIAGQALELRLKHRLFSREVTAIVQTDEKGGVDLGPLTDIVQVNAKAAGPAGAQRNWQLGNPGASGLPGQVNGVAKEPLRVPVDDPGFVLSRAAVAFFEVEGTTFRVDHYGSLSYRDGYLEIAALQAGNYRLVFKNPNHSLDICIADGPVRKGFAAGRARLLQLSKSQPLQIAETRQEKDDLIIRLAGAGKATRVHVFSNYYLPRPNSGATLGYLTPSLAAFDVRSPRGAYVSGRDIGDEYRYILDRQSAGAYPGNMLSRPGLLLQPWAMDETERQDAVASGFPDSAKAAMLRSPADPSGRSGPSSKKAWNSGAAPGPAGVDFLPGTPLMLINLRVNKNGEVRVPLADLKDAHLIQILAVDRSETAYREWTLPERALQPRDLTLQTGFDPGENRCQQRLTTLLAKGGSLEIADMSSAQVEVYDSLDRVFRLYQTISRDETLNEFAFLLQWPGWNEQKKLESYGKYACHELNFFLYHKDRPFFDRVIAPYLANKRDKTFMDHWLLGADLKRYLEPWYHERLNIVERILLGQRLEGDRQRRHVQDLFEEEERADDHLNRLYDTAILGGALDASDDLGVQAAKEAATSTKLAGKTGLSRNRAMAPPMAEEEAGGAEEMMVSAESAIMDLDAFAEVDEVMSLFRGPEPTRAWAENNYYQLPIEKQVEDLVEVNAFWVDFAAFDGKGGFYSTHLAEASENFTEMMLALAVIDLPFAAGHHQTSAEGTKWRLTAAGPAIVYHKEVVPVAPPADESVLLFQGFFRADDRYRMEAGQRVEKRVSGEFLVNTVYGCNLILTNPTLSPRRLNVLLQIPQGALPANRGFYTRGVPVTLAAQATTSLEYYFYFPKTGTYSHFPANAAQEGVVIAAAKPAAFKVVAPGAERDLDSWEYLSQQADSARVLRYLAEENPEAVDLSRLAWRMKDAAFFDKAVATLSERRCFDRTLWSYSVLHNRLEPLRTYLRFVSNLQVGPYLASVPLTSDPVATHEFQLLEYEPLFNPRVHILGGKRIIPDQALARQYASLLVLLAHRPAIDDDDLLAVTYYLLLQDRVGEALQSFARVDRGKVATAMQYDYLQAYLSFFTRDLAAARAIADRYKDHPVPRWHDRFNQVLVQLDEIEGKAGKVTDPENREQTQQALAAREPTLDLQVTGQELRVGYRNLTRCQINYYEMDVELLFSRHPFLQEGGDRFAFIKPNRTQAVELPAGGSEKRVPLPEALRRANVFVEVGGGGKRASAVSYANDLTLEVMENYGRLRLTKKADGRPIAAAYVKVYARDGNGQVAFYKDGYTDLRGQFDYVSLSSGPLGNVARFSLLVLSPEDGAQVVEAAPPAR